MVGLLGAALGASPAAAVGGAVFHELLWPAIAQTFALAFALPEAIMLPPDGSGAAIHTGGGEAQVVAPHEDACELMLSLAKSLCDVPPHKGATALGSLAQAVMHGFETLAGEYTSASRHSQPQRGYLSCLCVCLCLS